MDFMNFKCEMDSRKVRLLLHPVPYADYRSLEASQASLIQWLRFFSPHSHNPSNTGNSVSALAVRLYSTLGGT